MACTSQCTHMLLGISFYLLRGLLIFLTFISTFIYILYLLFPGAISHVLVETAHLVRPGHLVPAQRKTYKVLLRPFYWVEGFEAETDNNEIDAESEIFPQKFRESVKNGSWDFVLATYNVDEEFPTTGYKYRELKTVRLNENRADDGEREEQRKEALRMEEIEGEWQPETLTQTEVTRAIVAEDDISINNNGVVVGGLLSRSETEEVVRWGKDGKIVERRTNERSFDEAAGLAMLGKFRNRG